MPLEQWRLVDEPADLDRGLSMLSGLEVVGVDVERADWDRYYRTAALIQVGGEGLVLVLDPMALEDLSPLDAFLADRPTVFHALENDLVPLEARGVKPPSLEDTAIAAAMLGLPTGLGPLLEEVLGVSLQADKQEMQRADWEARPIREDMIAYAAADVADLPALWTALEGRLQAAGRQQWYTEELQATLDAPSIEERRAWTRLKGVGRLSPEARARVRAMWSIREELARETDTAPGRIASDRVLVALAADPPRHAGELSKRGMRRQAVRQFGADLLVALSKASVDDLPPPSDGRIPSEEDRRVADTLRTIRAARAEELGIDAGVLCPSRTLLGAVLDDPASAEELREALGLLDWQWEQIGAHFCEALELALPGSQELTAPVRGSDPGTAAAVESE